MASISGTITPCKVSGNGQAKVLTTAELKQLFSEGLIKPRDHTLFAICLFTGCRISEALALQKNDVKNKTITFRKSTTKGKLKTRTIDIPLPLLGYLAEYEPPVNPYNPYLFVYKSQDTRRKNSSSRERKFKDFVDFNSLTKPQKMIKFK